MTSVIKDELTIRKSYFLLNANYLSKNHLKFGFFCKRSSHTLLLSAYRSWTRVPLLHWATRTPFPQQYREEEISLPGGHDGPDHGTVRTEDFRLSDSATARSSTDQGVFDS